MFDSLQCKPPGPLKIAIKAIIARMINRATHHSRFSILVFLDSLRLARLR